jgi:hypothetical protein
MYCSLKTSSIDDRTVLVTIANSIALKTLAGIIKCFMAPQNRAGCPLSNASIVRNPVIGMSDPASVNCPEREASKFRGENQLK